MKIAQNGMQAFHVTVNCKMFDILLSCYSSQSVYCYAFRPRVRERLLVMNVLLHDEKILFCYNVPVLAVLYNLNRRIFIENRFSFKITGLRLPRLSISRTPL